VAGLVGNELAWVTEKVGVFGHAGESDAYGVRAYNVASTGAATAMFATTYSGAGYGILGENKGTAGKGIWGIGHGCGVGGTTSATSGGIGVFGSTAGANYSIYGENTTGGYAGYFKGNMLCTGTLTINGSKAAVVPTSRGDRKLYCQESPEVWFEDVGEGQLVAGKARIDLDSLFLETVNINDQHPMKVFIQLNDDCNGVYVKRHTTGFEVQELRGGNSQAHFTYRVMAKRKGFETARLEAAGDLEKVAAFKETKK
jgi:hypothetical protein